MKTDLSEFIIQCLENELGIKFEPEYPKKRKPHYDYCSKSNEFEIIVEIEIRREDPVNNVAKAWRLLEGKNGKKNFFIHFFSGKYSEKDSKYLNAVFIGERMREAGVAHYMHERLKVEPPVGSRGIFEITDEQKKEIRQQIQKTSKGIRKLLIES